ncbi:DUF4838 domain-containing protein [Streptomyces sp. NPDC057486]|uniref:DUF4838 domain-containing protein n=1 Tax=Streptomyces sp. NPDC057486 TaxID=3346145 RepID=UPI0036CD0462
MQTRLHRRSFLIGATGAAAAALLPLGATPASALPADSGGPLPLVDGEHAAATITWYGSEVARFAAEEVRDYVLAITGVSLPLAEAEVRPRTPAGSGVVLRSGRSRIVPDAWIADARDALGDAPADSFAVVTGEDRAVLLGTGDRGPLYAAYALVEQFGVRFFAPSFAFYEGHSEHVPRSRSLRVTPQRYVSRPGWALRRQYVEEGYSHTRSSLPPLIDWMAKNRLNTLVIPKDYLGQGVTTYDSMRDVIAREAARRGLNVEVGGHGYDSFLPPAQYPQYYTSGGPLFDIYNPEALDAYVSRVVEYLRARPEITVFDCWPPDVWQFQNEILRRYGTPSNAESVVVNKLAAAVREQLPGVRVERIAYASTVEPPDPAYACDPDVIVDFAPYSRNYTGGLGDSAVAANAKLAGPLRRWRESFDGTLCMYEYYRRYRWRSLPVQVLDTVSADVAFEAALGVDGMGMYCEPADWIPHEHLQSLVAAKAWDPGLDGPAYLDGYLTARFGPAAVSAMRRYFTATGKDPDVFNGTAGAADGVEHYSAARTALLDARDGVADDSGRLVVDRLVLNTDIALADMEVGRSGTPAVREKYRRAVEANRFAGVVLPNQQVRQRWGAQSPSYQDAAIRQAIADEYRSPAAGSVVPDRVTVAPGGSAEVTLTAYDVDFTGHTVTWQADAPSGLHVAPSSGTLRVAGQRTRSVTVTLSASGQLPAGGQEVVFTLRTEEGTRLPKVVLKALGS